MFQQMRITLSYNLINMLANIFHRESVAWEGVRARLCAHAHLHIDHHTLSVSKQPQPIQVNGECK